MLVHHLSSTFVWLTILYFFIKYFTILLIRRHYRPRSPRPVPSIDSPFGITTRADNICKRERTSEDRVLRNDVLTDSCDYKPRAKVRRTFSTQPTSKFTLNSGFSNGVIPPHTNFVSPTDINERDKRDVIPNGPTVNNNNSMQISWNGTTSLTPHKNIFSTAPMKAVYALNFPQSSGNASVILSNNLFKGTNKHGTLTTTNRHPHTLRNSSGHRFNQQTTALSRR